MCITKSDDYIISLIKELIKQPVETEWLEFKHNKYDKETIGEYISALSNSAALNSKSNAYMIWGVEDETHKIIGTTFNPLNTVKGNEALENWLLRLLNPKIDFRFYPVVIDGFKVVLLEIEPANTKPVMFNNIEFVRLNSHKKKLKEFPEKERRLWRIFDKIPFEKQVAMDNISETDVLGFLEYTKYFEMLNIPLPENRSSIISSLEQDDLIQQELNKKYSILNLGAILFAKDLGSFKNLKRKAIRVIQYKGESKVDTIKEIVGNKGYAVGFEGLIDYINNMLPSNEVINKAFRETKKMYPELSIRELVANALIHQDFSQRGNSVMIEIYSNRFEVTNPGEPLVDTERFLDSPPKSRNEILASFMRRINICEERGSGIDKVVFQTEVYQLPAPIFKSTNGYTISILFAHKDLKDMDRLDKIRAAYMHSVLRYIKNDFMTNTTLRERFGIEAKNTATVSRIIKETIKDSKIEIYDENVGTRARTYIPWWAK